MRRGTCKHQPDLPTRLLAAGAAVLVLLVTLLAGSPDLHASLHALHSHEGTTPCSPAADHPDATCAVSLLAQSAEAPDFPDALITGLIRMADNRPPNTQALPEQAARHHHPSRGPPSLS